MTDMYGRLRSLIPYIHLLVLNFTNKEIEILSFPFRSTLAKLRIYCTDLKSYVFTYSYVKWLMTYTEAPKI